LNKQEKILSNQKEEKTGDILEQIEQIEVEQKSARNQKESLTQVAKKSLNDDLARLMSRK
jgi:hypothetical protein